MDEEYLIAEAKNGDLEAFNRLVLFYQNMAYNLAYRMVSDGDIAADITQKSFLSAYRNLNSFRGGSFKAWVLRMVTNASYDELRRRKRHPTLPLEPVDDYDEEIESPEWMEDPGPTPEMLVERGELDRAIQRCLGGLPDEFRAVALMVDVEGMDYQEVAQVIDKPLGTIKSRLARARMKLRECLGPFLELLPVELRLTSK